MSWELSGRSMELCSCNALCPCWLGPEGQPDQEWCAAIFGFDIEIFQIQSRSGQKGREVIEEKRIAECNAVVFTDHNLGKGMFTEKGFAHILGGCHDFVG